MAGLFIVLFGSLDERLMRYDHQNQQYEQIIRQQRNADRICNHTEQRRHDENPQIGEGHLHSYDSLGFIFFEVPIEIIEEMIPAYERGTPNC